MSKRSLAAPMLVAAAVLALIVTSTLSAAPERRQQRIMLVQKNSADDAVWNVRLLRAHRGAAPIRLGHVYARHS